jgi:gliding motility-associated-like protein
MKHFLLIASVFFFSTLKSQCFEIQSILVDACAGSSEGQNEMVTFQVGSAPLNSANLSVNWPNNSWLGLTQNASTAAAISSINATIQGCGFLKEPVAGVLPAHSKVLLITSTAFNSTAQSFAGLTDTLIVLFQSVGNTAGHFANYQAGGGTRTLAMSFTLPVGCTDAVTYDRALLVMQNGSIGAQDGGAVEFTPAGLANYVNHGCQAPYIPLTVDAGLNQSICSGTQSFTATASGAYTSVLWTLGTGATGSFAPSNSLTTTYTPGVGESGTVKLYVNLIKACGTQTTSVKDSVLLTFSGAPTVTVSPSVVTICTGQSVTLSANTSSAATYTWSTGAHTSTIQVNTPGIYTVQVSNSCGSSSQTATVTSGSAAPTLTVVSTNTLLCSGQSATLSLNGSTGTYTWSTGATTPTIVVNSFGAYSATVTNSCGQATAFIQINASTTPTVSISPAAPVLCPGMNTTLTASGNMTNYQWSTGATGNPNQISVSTPGIYTVSISNLCGTATASVTVSSFTMDPLIVSASSTTICPNETATLTASGGGIQGNSPTYTWMNSSITGPVVTTTGGTVTVVATNSCGSYSQSIVVYNFPVNAALTANPVSGVKPLTVTFTNGSTGATGYNWIFGNGNTATGFSVSPQTYVAAGDYTASITVTDGVCSDQAFVVIHVLNETPELVVPNVFTPNNDFINDFFKVRGSNISDFHAAIYDRWGLELFNWSDVAQGWDGKVNGNLCNDGVYFYIISCRDFDNKDIKKQGSFTLLR